MIELSNKTIIVTGAGLGIGVRSDKLQTCIVDVSDYSQM